VGRPVFFICRSTVLGSDESAVRPHFDTAHQAIVKWDPLNPGEAMEGPKIHDPRDITGSSTNARRLTSFEIDA
jgi:hypothetical protein